MPLPAIYDVAQQYLFEDSDKMRLAGIPSATIDHVLRLRDVYNYWLSHPNKRDRDIVSELQARGVSKRQAYYDLNVIKELLGALQKNTKDYIRYRFTEGILRAIDKAEQSGNLDAVIKGWNTLAKYHQLDKPDDEDRRFDITPQAFHFTDDPSVMGITPVPNIRELIKKKKEQYWNDDVVDVDFEPIEFNEDQLFNPKKNGEAAGLP